VDNKTKKYVSEFGTWKRLLFMILFVVIINIAEAVVFLVAAVQFLFKLLTGKTNAQMRNLGGSLGAYVREIIVFLTYHGDDMPYPFSPWPKASAGNGAKKSGGRDTGKKVAAKG